MVVDEANAQPAPCRAHHSSARWATDKGVMNYGVILDGTTRGASPLALGTVDGARLSRSDRYPPRLLRRRRARCGACCCRRTGPLRLRGTAASRAAATSPVDRRSSEAHARELGGLRRVVCER